MMFRARMHDWTGIADVVFTARSFKHARRYARRQSDGSRFTLMLVLREVE